MLRNLAFLVIFGFCSTARAGIYYDEVYDGTLPDLEAPIPVLNFGLGTNTIVGAFILSSPFGPDMDNFSFSIPEGMKLVSGTANMKELETSGPPGVNPQLVVQGIWSLRNGSSELEYIGGPCPGVYSISSVPLEAGVYTMSSWGQGGGVVGYTLTFEVEAAQTAPEPSTLGLLAAGLTTLCLWRKTRL